MQSKDQNAIASSNSSSMHEGELFLHDGEEVSAQNANPLPPQHLKSSIINSSPSKKLSCSQMKMKNHELFEKQSIDSKSFQLLKAGAEQIKHFPGKTGVVLIGSSGAGKSTTFLFMNEIEMKAINQSFPQLDYAYPEKYPDLKDNVRPGHTFNAETIEPFAYQSKDSPYCYYDTIGFEDTRGPNVQLFGGLCLHKIFKLQKSLKIIAVIDFTTIFSSRCVQGKKNLEYIANSLPGISDFKNQIGFIITRANRDIDKGAFQKELKEQTAKLTNLDGRLKSILEAMTETNNLVLMKEPSRDMVGDEPINHYYQDFVDNARGMIESVHTVKNCNLKIQVGEKVITSLSQNISEEPSKILSEFEKYKTEINASILDRYKEMQSQMSANYMINQLKDDFNELQNIHQRYQKLTLVNIGDQILELSDFFADRNVKLIAEQILHKIQMIDFFKQNVDVPEPEGFYENVSKGIEILKKFFNEKIDAIKENCKKCYYFQESQLYKQFKDQLSFGQMNAYNQQQAIIARKFNLLNSQQSVSDSINILKKDPIFSSLGINIDSVQTIQQIRNAIVPVYNLNSNYIQKDIISYNNEIVQEIQNSLITSMEAIDNNNTEQTVTEIKDPQVKMGKEYFYSQGVSLSSNKNQKSENLTQEQQLLIQNESAKIMKEGGASRSLQRKVNDLQKENDQLKIKNKDQLKDIERLQLLNKKKSENSGIGTGDISIDTNEEQKDINQKLQNIFDLQDKKSWEEICEGLEQLQGYKAIDFLPIINYLRSSKQRGSQQACCNIF